MAHASGQPTADLLSVDDYLRDILERLGPLQPYDQPLLEALGLPVCEDVQSSFDLPQFTNSAMDGYAVRHADVEGATDDRPAVLPVVGESAAGSASSYAMSPGSAIKIMTGAPLPAGADTIIPVESTDRGSGSVTVFRDAPRGAHIRPAAEDIRAGDLVLEEGAVLGSREIGLLAALGRGQVRARPRPRVVVLSTGSELREPGQEIGADAIYDGNSYMLAAAARSAGAIAYRVGIVPDNPEDFTNALSDQLVRADLVITSGGVSMGDYDVVKETLSRLGTVDFVRVAMQPGKPQGFGFVGEEGTPIMTLPGNPVSAYVSFEVFGVPAVRRMMGRLPYRRPLVQAVLAEEIRSVDGKRQYLRAQFEVGHRGAKVTPVGGSGSHLIGGLAGANALIVVDEHETALNMGDTANVLVLDQSF